MTGYVEYGGLTTAPGPMRCEDVTLYVFWARASHGRLAELCRRVFAEPTSGAVDCEPLLSGWVAITFGTIGRIAVLTPPHDVKGHVHERHAAIWVPVHCRGPAPTPSVAAFIPYMWLDNPISVASGREVYGYAKNWGWPEFAGSQPAEPSGATGAAARAAAVKAPVPRRFRLDAYAIESYGRDERPQRRRLLELTRVGARGAGAEARPGPEAGREARDLAGLASASLAAMRARDRDLARLGPVAEQARLALAEGVDQIFLRQFRSPTSGEGADPSQVVAGPAKVAPGSVEARPLLPHRLSLQHLDSHPLGTELGLEEGWCPAFRVRMAFTVERGTVLWPAPFMFE